MIFACMYREFERGKRERGGNDKWKGSGAREMVAVQSEGKIK